MELRTITQIVQEKQQYLDFLITDQQRCRNNCKGLTSGLWYQIVQIKQIEIDRIARQIKNLGGKPYGG